MGNFYVNISLKVDPESFVTQMSKLMEDPGVVGPARGDWLTFSSEALETQDQEVIDAYGTGLSRHVAGPLVSVLNHDDDILRIDVFRGGERIATYDSCPDYFLEDATGEDVAPKMTGAEVFDSLGTSEGTTTSAILQKPAVFACETHAAFVAHTGLPDYSPAFGFKYAKRGEFPHLELFWSKPEAASS